MVICHSFPANSESWKSGCGSGSPGRLLCGTSARPHAPSYPPARDGFADNGAIDLRTNICTSKPSDQIGTTPPIVVNNRRIIGERIIDNVNRYIPSGVVHI